MNSLIICAPHTNINSNRTRAGSIREKKNADIAALEKLIELKNIGIVAQIWAVSVASKSDGSNQALRHALALGSDRVSVILSDVNLVWDKLGIAESIYSVVKPYKLDLVMCGCDEVGCSSVGSILASLLGINYFGKVRDLTINNQKHNVVINRDIGRGYSETLSTALPVVIGTDFYIERSQVYPTLIGIKKATCSPIEEITAKVNPEANVKRLFFMKSEPNRIPVRSRSNYPKESLGQNRMNYIIGRVRGVDNPEKKEANESVQEVTNMIKLLEAKDLL